VKVGSTVYTAGTIASDADGTIHGADCYEQCCYILNKLQAVLAEAGAELGHVVKTKAYVISAMDAEGFTRAHFEYFGEVRPAATCVMVSGLLHPSARVELELVAAIPA
jgi:enamine deaminase RidA (YjgF/YER057c/UK114 family)